MNDFDSIDIEHSSQELENTSLKTVFYLIPVIGFFPSLWALYLQNGSREQLATCRLSITLALSWLVIYVFLATGNQASNLLSLRLLILNTFATSGYFLVSVWLIIRTIRGKNSRIPGFSRFAERFIGKHLS
jgi:hypothetical protein